MTHAVATPAIGRQEISDSHARGLRRDLFRRMDARLAPQLRTLRVRLDTVQRRHPSSREAMAVYTRAWQSLRSCSEYFSHGRTAQYGSQSVAVLLQPGTLAHADGDEPVLVATLYLMTARDGWITVESRRCGRISHHAIERMYQRLRTSSHESVLAELRGALWWVSMLQCSAFLSPRSLTIHQLPIPTVRGALRCIRDVALGELEVRTFTVGRPGDRVDASLATLHRWAEVVPGEGANERAFAALLREPANRWWRERYEA